MKVAFCAAEASPFVKVGGLADVCGALPLALEKCGCQVTVFLPKYGCISQRKFKLKKIFPGVYESQLGEGIRVFFLAHKKYFDRKGVYGEGSDGYADNLERFQYFCEKILKVSKALKLRFNIVHCHDWHTALIPVLLKEKLQKDPFYRSMRSVLTIHNLVFQGLFPKRYFPKLKLQKRLMSENGFAFYEHISLLKAGLIYSDTITTVSPQYRKEILIKKFGCGLDRVLRKRRKDLKGILNGIDFVAWDPQKDPLLKANYTFKTCAREKKVNKRALQRKFQLSIKENIPLLGFVGRLFHQKGIDLIVSSMDPLMLLGVQIIIQGVGDAHVERSLKKAAKKYPKNLGVCLKFDEENAHQVYAGSDMFLMPSRFEPCGLGQMISMRYGSVPIAFKTGGLSDTIVDDNTKPHLKNGFMFDQYEDLAFVRCVERAVKDFGRKKHFRQIVQNGMKKDFSWDKSARSYKRVYQCLLSD